MNPTEMLEKLRRSKNDVSVADKTIAAGQDEFMSKVYDGLRQVQPLMKFRKRGLFGSSLQPFVLTGNLQSMRVKFGDFSLICGFAQKDFRIWPDQSLLANNAFFIGQVCSRLPHAAYASDAVDAILRILVKYEE